jgi:hypothetical protein
VTLGLTRKRAKPRWLALGLIVALLTGLGATAVLAVHDEAFQLDGDVLAATTTSVGGSTQTVDWDSLFDSAGAKKTLPTDFTASGFKKDFNHAGGTTSFATSDPTTYATGSKDTLPISGWQCNFDNNVNSKVDVMNAYTAAYTDPGSGDQFIYFGLERNVNTGDANVGFWFLQDAVGCETTGSAQTFTGAHQDGDLLVVSAFTNGGSVSTIDVYRWTITAPDTVGALDPTPKAHGVDCRAPATPIGDAACAVANTADITTPWLTAAGKNVGHTLKTAEFFEGGLNLTKSDLGGKCFNTFIGDTRSSQSLTATLFDYAGGVIGECTSETVTTPSIATAQIPADPSDASVSVTDSATVSVTGVNTWSGDVTWHLCKVDSPALCGTGGVAIGAAKTASNSTPTVISDAAVVTAAGRYCWRADFAGDSAAGVPASSDSRSSECFTITPRQPTLTTQATSGPVDFGSKISDTVTLSNTAHKPGTGGPAGADGSINPTTLGGDATGAISIVAYGPDSCSTVAFTSSTIAASGNGSYGGAGTAFEFLPDAPGQYVFVASYAGDSPNTLDIAAGTCAGAPASEKVTVRTIPTTIKTKQSWFPNDTATVTSTVGNLGSGGSVAFSLYDNATCTGTAKYSETKSITGGSTSQEVSTNNTTFNIFTLYTDAADATVTYSWKVVYTPGAADTAHTGKQSSCNAEHFSIKYTNDAGPGSDLP